MSETSSAVASASNTAHGIVSSSSNPTFKIIGISLAVGSGLLIGSSFVIKKKGLLNSTAKYGNQAGEGHAYLKNWLWWLGMVTMIVGEICNFVAYAFTEAILVTPMGALSVVVAAVLSHFLLKEKLTFFGWIGCTLCIMGAVILALNAPEEQSVTTINAFKHLFLSVGFLVWASLLIAGSLIVIFFVAPKWGKKSMLPYISICSLIGGISVSCTQGLGASIVTSVQGNNQVKNWFFWFLFVFVVITLLTEINYLNKALELFNTSMVVPVYFCFFSSATLITSFILYQGLKASAVTLITMVLGFLVTCLGITLLQLSKVDPTELNSKLDRKSTILMEASKHQTEDAEKGQVTSYEDPGMDALRGGFGAVGSIIRARSVSRKLSNGSSLSGSKFGPSNLSTHGLGGLQRFQLSDNPTPSDGMSQISLYSSKSPTALSSGRSFKDVHGYYPSPRSKSQIRFEESDIVHQYQNDRSQSHRTPTSPIYSGPHDHRQFSGSMYPPVLEVDEDMFNEEVEAKGNYGSSRTKVHLDDAPKEVATAPIFGRSSHKNSYESHPSQAKIPDRALSTSHSNYKGLAGIFSFPSGPDLSLNIGKKSREERRSRKGGEHVYPHLSRKDRNNPQENEERQALVPNVSTDKIGRDSAASFSSLSDGDTQEGDEPVSAISTKATIGLGHKIYLGPKQSIGGTDAPGTADLSDTRTSGTQVPGNVRGTRRLPDIPSFTAGPPYNS
ncbi:hypothetical protein L204_104798 [Cryptococcus depauperatus]